VFSHSNKNQIKRLEKKEKKKRKNIRGRNRTIPSSRRRLRDDEGETITYTVKAKGSKISTTAV
jgi:hypothetical protein